MNKFRYRLVILFFLVQSSSLVYSFDIKGFFKSMGDAFGAAPVGYVYNFEIWSDAIVPLHAELQGIASFMGAFFPSAKGYFNKQTLPSIFDAKGTISKALYHNAKYYFKFYISDHSQPHISPIYKDYFTQLPLKQHDPNVYYYHAFTTRSFSHGSFVHKPQIELIGYQNPSDENPNSTDKGSVKISSQLSTLAFVNNSGVDVQVSLTYGSSPYTFTVEKYSYNTLSVPTPQAPSSSTNSASTSDDSGTVTITKSETKKESADILPPPFSLRPNTIQFSMYNSINKKNIPFQTLMLPSQGFDGNTYTIEIFQDSDTLLQVGIQGLMPGNYDLPMTSRIRDLTPCPCTFWYQSFAQAGSNQGYSDLPGQLWVVYPGNDSYIRSKVTPGQVVSWNLTRPLIAQKNCLVYFVYVVTTDDSIAEKFVTKVAAKTIGTDVTGQYIKAANTPFVPVSTTTSIDGLATDTNAVKALASITPEEQVQTLMGQLSVSSGVIEDTQLGIIGYVVGTDIFTSSGLGFGRFYYTLGPSVMSMSNFVASLLNYLDSSKTSALAVTSGSVQAGLTTTVNQWLAQYITNPVDVQKQLQQFLIEYGNSNLLDATGSQLSQFGKSCLNSLMTGPISLKFPSLQLSTVTNQYVYDFGQKAPDKMPTTITQIQPIPMPVIAEKSMSIAKKLSPLKKPINNRIVQKNKVS